MKTSPSTITLHCLPLYGRVSSGALAGLPGGERLRAEHYLDDAAREAFVRSRLALRHLLGRKLMRAPGDVPLVLDLHGRPRCPLFVGDFNLSHAPGALLLGLSAQARIGVDIERADAVQPDLMAYLARVILHPDEVAYLTQKAPDARALTRIWVRKEACLKALGTGFGADTATQLNVLAPRVVYGDQVLSLQDVALGRGRYTAALAVIADAPPAYDLRTRLD